MFIYEKGNSLNLTFKGHLPVETPDVSIKGYKNGAALFVNGLMYGVADGEEFEGKAKTVVYQRDRKLMITFRGVEGMSNPEVMIDEISEGVYAVEIGSDIVTLTVVEEGVLVDADKVAPVMEPVADPEPVMVEEDIPEVLPEEELEEPVEE